MVSFGLNWSDITIMLMTAKWHTMCISVVGYVTHWPFSWSSYQIMVVYKLAHLELGLSWLIYMMNGMLITKKWGVVSSRYGKMESINLITGQHEF